MLRKLPSALIAVVLLLRNHLQQNAAGNVLLRLFVHHHELDLVEHQAADIRQRDVAALDRVVEPPVRILLNDPRFAHDPSPGR